MSQTKEAAQSKRRTNAGPVLAAASLSFSLASGSSAAIGAANPDPATSASIALRVMDEEEISDVHLTTFRVFDEQRTGTRRPCSRPTMVSQGACGTGLYYPQNPPEVTQPVYQHSPRPIRSAHRYKHW